MVKELNRAYVADKTGVIQLSNVPAGQYHLVISCIGYANSDYDVSLPVKSATIIIFLEKKHDEEQEVVVTATRLSRTIANIPTRVEVISGEELDEKSNMQPGEI